MLIHIILLRMWQHIMLNHSHDDTSNAEQKPPDQDLFNKVATSLDKIASFIDQQNRLQDELNHVGRELNTLRYEKQLMDEDYRNRITQLEQALQRLMEEKAGSRQARSEETQDHGQTPDTEFLKNPLTVHYPPKRYIGIKDNQNASLNFQRLIETIQNNVYSPKTVSFSWQAREGFWTLLAVLKQPGARRVRKILLVAKPTVTPQGNSVTEVVRMTIEKKELSKNEMLKFLKLFKDSMDQWET